MQLLPEEQFIINCLRSELGVASNNEISRVDLSTLDCNTIYEKSIQWGIVPSLYKIIKKLSSTLPSLRMSEHFLQKWKSAHIATLIKNKERLKSLVEVLMVLNTAGIKVILLKGIHLVQFVHKDMGLRAMNDIDILVKKEDISKAVELLFQMGYGFVKKRRDAQEQSISIKELIKSCDRHVPALGHPKGINKLDLHWTIPGSSFNVDTEGLWKRAITVEINGTSVLVLSLEDLLLHLSLHTAFHHKFNVGIKQLYDIATTINNHKINWDKLKLRSYEWGTEKCLYLTLRFAKEILGARVPERILHALKPDTLNEKILLEAQKRIFFQEIKKSAFEDVPYLNKFHPDNSLLKRTSFLFNRIFITRKELAFNYSLSVPSKHIYFYYFVRVISLLYRHIPRYIPFFLYLLLHKKSSPYFNDLDVWLIPPGSEKSNNLANADFAIL